MSTIKKRAYFTATSLVLIDVRVRVSNVIKDATSNVAVHNCNVADVIDVVK